jgi:hypothetical protein
MSTDLPAGPALDLAVARACGFQAEISQPRAAYEGQCCARLRPDAPCEFSRWKLFRPSSDISDAFEALGSMTINQIPILWEVKLTIDRRYEAVIFTRELGNGWRHVSNIADTPALAICRAIVETTKETKP